MLLRFATDTEIQMSLVVTDDGIRDGISDLKAIFIETSLDEPIMSVLTQEEANEIFGNFSCAFATGHIAYVEEETLDRLKIPGTLNRRFEVFGECRVPKRRFHFKFPKPDVVHTLNYARVLPRVVDVEVDNKSTPTPYQKDAMEMLTENPSAWEDFHGKSQRVLLEKGWVEENGNVATVTDAGRAALARIDSKRDQETPVEKIIPLVSVKQHEALAALALSAEAFADVHFKTKDFLIESKWVNRDGTFRTDGVDMLGKLGIELTGNVINDEFVNDEKNEPKQIRVNGIYLTENQIGAFTMLAASKEAISGIHGRTKNTMIDLGWINEDGTFRTDGAAVLAILKLEMTGNVVNDDYVAPQEEELTKPARKSNDSVVLSESQIEVFKKPRLFKLAHTKTKNTMINKGWFTEDGVITELGERIRAAI